MGPKNFWPFWCPQILGRWTVKLCTRGRGKQGWLYSEAVFLNTTSATLTWCVTAQTTPSSSTQLRSSMAVIPALVPTRPFPGGRSKALLKPSRFSSFLFPYIYSDLFFSSLFFFLFCTLLCFPLSSGALRCNNRVSSSGCRDFCQETFVLCRKKSLTDNRSNLLKNNSCHGAIDEEYNGLNNKLNGIELFICC